MIALPALSAEPDLILDIEGYQVEGFNPLSNSRTDTILKPYTGKLEDLSYILDAAEALEKAIHKKGYNLVSVTLPEQPVTNKIIILRTKGFVVSGINAENNKHFSNKNIKRSAPGLSVGSNPNLRSLQRSLSVANLHPSKRVTLNFISRDKESEKIDVNLNVSDKKTATDF